MCDKAVNTCHFTIQFVRECCKTQELRDKAINKYYFELYFTPI